MTDTVDLECGEPVASAPLKEERTLREVLDTALRYIAGFEGRNELAAAP